MPATAKFVPDYVQWTEPMQQAFVSLKNSLCDHVILCVPCQSDSFVLCTDASGKGVGEILYVHRKDELLPTAFYSRQKIFCNRNRSIGYGDFN